MRIAMGINHPAGRSRTFSAHGRRCCRAQGQSMRVGLCRSLLGSAYCDDLVMFDGDDDGQDDDDDKDDPAHCWRGS
jgi:hypothetical protein